jgi:hypothetical protein
MRSKKTPAAPAAPTPVTTTVRQCVIRKPYVIQKLEEEAKRTGEVGVAIVAERIIIEHFARREAMVSPGCVV